MLSYRECFQRAIGRPCCAFSCMIFSSLHRQHRLISLIIMSSKPKPEPPAQSVTPAPAARQKAQPVKHVKIQCDLNKDLAMHWRNRPS
jgi:hypothetical protein